MLVGPGYELVCACQCARARPTHNIHTNTLRGLKIYLLFNRLVRRYVMSVNVSGGMYVCVGVCVRARTHTTNTNTHRLTSLVILD